MLTQEYRPKTFAEVKGQDLPKRIFKAIVRNPDTAPRSLIFAGGRGLAKTSCLRIFARALNCQNRANGDCCNQCAACLSIREGSSLFLELDSAIVGNVEQMKGLREMFGYSVQSGYKVIGFDECHLASKSAQSSLLSVLEEAPNGTFFVFLTTDPERILDTIVSRSLPIEFKPLTDEAMGLLLHGIAAKEEIDLTDEVVSHICRRVKGHARDGTQMLELVRMLGPSEYLNEVKLMDDSFEELIQAYLDKKKDEALRIITEIVSQPVAYIEQDFEIFIKRKSDEVFMQGKKNKAMHSMIIFYIKNHRYLQTTNDWYVFLSALSTHFDDKVESKGKIAGAAPFSKV